MSNNLNKEALLEKYSTSWKSLNEYAHLSPIVGLGAVTVKQVEEYCGVDHDTFQVARQRLKKQLDVLGMYTDVARHIGAVVPGAAKTESYGYLLPLEDGGVTEIPCGRYTYFTPASVALMIEVLANAVQISADQAGQEPSAKANNDTDTMAVKSVPFLGTELMAARDSDGQIWAGVRWMCDGLGLSRNQRDTQIQKVKSDKVLLKGAGNFQLPTNGGNQVVLCLKLDYVPLWLAKINITPAMEAETPDLADKLEQYQLRAKDVLANAFLPNAPDSSLPIPKDYPSALRALADQFETNMKLAEENSTLSTSNAMLAKQERTWKPQQVVNRLIRLYSSIVFGNNFKLGWSDFYHELEYRKSISLKMRNGKGSLLNRVKKDEWPDVIAVAAALCHENGIDPAKAVNQTNAQVYLEENYAG